MEVNVATNISKEQKNTEIIINAPERTKEIEDLEKQIVMLIQSSNQLIGIKNKTAYVLKYNDIMCFYSEEGTTYCRTENETFRVESKLYELEEKLDNNFLRISKSSIINLNFVECFNAEFVGTIEVIFKDKSKEYVSRRKIKDVKEKIKEWRRLK